MQEYKMQICEIRDKQIICREGRWISWGREKMCNEKFVIQMCHLVII